MRDYPFAYAPLLIGLTLLLGAAFGQIKPKITAHDAPRQSVVSVEDNFVAPETSR